MSVKICCYSVVIATLKPIRGDEKRADIHFGIIFMCMLNEFFDPKLVTFKEVDKDMVRDFVQKHYLGKFPQVPQFYVGIFYNNNLVGAVIYGRPAAPNLEKSVFKSDAEVNYKNLLELQRLFIVDDEELLPKDARKNLAGYSITKANELAAHEFPEVKAIVSYSDPDHHSGSVYKATNAIYQGRGTGNRMFKRKSDGQLVRTNRLVPGEEGEFVRIVGKDRWVYPMGSASQKNWVRKNLSSNQDWNAEDSPFVIQNEPTDVAAIAESKKILQELWKNVID